MKPTNRRYRRGTGDPGTGLSAGAAGLWPGPCFTIGNQFDDPELGWEKILPNLNVHASRAAAVLIALVCVAGPAFADALKPEFRVDSYTTDDPAARLQEHPSTAPLAGGGFVTAWGSWGQACPDEPTTCGFDIFAQRFDDRGRKVGPEFQVNTDIEDTQIQPSVAGLADGGFVILWWSRGGDWILGQRYDSRGRMLGGEFEVVRGVQQRPAVAALTGGGFVVAWTGEDRSLYGVFGQRYNWRGKRAGRQFRINAHQTLTQSGPALAARADGGFVATWSSYGQADPLDPFSADVYARLFDRKGKRASRELRVNRTIVGHQTSIGLAAMKNDEIIVAWNARSEDQTEIVALAQRLDRRGRRAGKERLLNGQGIGSLASLDGTGFVAAWHRNDKDGYPKDVMVRRYTRKGRPVSPAVRINDYALKGGWSLSIAGLGKRSYVGIWASEHPRHKGIFGRRLVKR
ncbi:hypothetical protein [Microbaculum marinum]|uniref:Uncharacterized protein n=1 Tax=Microbaculum marinum TaxID=1764581 RepID=A0AAW9RUM4_9HYPH